MINLFISFYNEPQELRKKELVQCLIENCNCVYIDKIHVLLEPETQIPYLNNKIEYIPIGKRTTYKDFFELVNSTTGDNDINIIANTDIYFDESILLSHCLDNDSCFALSRWEINADGSKNYIQRQIRGDSQDTWIFKGKINSIDVCDFTLGKGGCDNRIAYEIKKSGYKISNPSRNIHTWHLHVSNIRNYIHTKEHCVPEPYLKVYVTHLVSKVLHVGLSATGVPYNGLQRAFVNNFSDYEEINTNNKNLNIVIQEAARCFKPDVVFIQIQAGGIITEETVKFLKEIGSFVVNFTGDVRQPIPKFYYELGKHIDYTLFSNMQDVEVMQSEGYRSAFLEMGIDETIYCQTGDFIESAPIVFMGNNYHNQFPLSEERRNMCQLLKQKFGEKFKVYGSGWIKGDGNFMNSQPNEAAAYRGSKIAINLSHFEIKDYSSDRLLRILGSGVLCLAKWYPDIEKRFIDGIHLRVWKTFEELEDLINYYLEHEDERKTIAQNGCKLVHNNYTFNHMIRNVISLYSKSKAL